MKSLKGISKKVAGSLCNSVETSLPLAGHSVELYSHIKIIHKPNNAIKGRSGIFDYFIEVNGDWLFPTNTAFALMNTIMNMENEEN